MAASDHSPEWRIGSRVWDLWDSGPLQVSVLFVDLVGSTEFASVLGLEEYARLSKSFHEACLSQCRHFFEDYRASRYVPDGRHYQIELSGDELCVFLHTEKPHDDVYQLVCLAIALKCAWLGTPVNFERTATGRDTIELASGIHSGPVWATRTPQGFDRRGFAVNLAKRIESASRGGERFRIYISDPAFKLVNRRMRNLIFGTRQVVDLKGAGSPVGVYELTESFVDPTRRMTSELAKGFAEVARRALTTNTFDLWIHSCMLVASGACGGSVADEALVQCDQVLNIDPKNAVALYYRAEAEREHGRLETARLYLEDLTRHWPTLGDGWLALGRVLKEQGALREARRCLIQAYRYGVEEGEEALPDGGAT